MKLLNHACATPRCSKTKPTKGYEMYEMKAQAKINGWSVLNTGDGIAAKHLGDSTLLEVCLSVDGDGELIINVYQEGVDEPVFVAIVRESTT